MAGSNKSTDLMKNANDVTQRASAQHNGRPTARVIVEYVQTLGRQVVQVERCRQIQAGGALLTQPPTTSFFLLPPSSHVVGSPSTLLYVWWGLCVKKFCHRGGAGIHTHTLCRCQAVWPVHQTTILMYKYIFFFLRFFYFIWCFSFSSGISFVI